MAKKAFKLEDLADGSSKLCIAARINDKGDAEVILHGTDKKEKAAYKFVILFAMIIKALEKKTGFDSYVLHQVAREFLEMNYPYHNSGCIKEEDINH